MIDYIVIDKDIHRVDTESEREDALAAMRDAGWTAAPIYRGDEDGDGFDDIRTDLTLFIYTHRGGTTMTKQYHTIRLDYDPKTALCTVWFRGKRQGTIPTGVDLDERTFIPMLQGMFVNNEDEVPTGERR